MPDITNSVGYIITGIVFLFAGFAVRELYGRFCRLEEKIDKIFKLMNDQDKRLVVLETIQGAN